MVCVDTNSHVDPALLDTCNLTIAQHYLFSVLLGIHCDSWLLSIYRILYHSKPIEFLCYLVPINFAMLGTCWTSTLLGTYSLLDHSTPIVICSIVTMVVAEHRCQRLSGKDSILHIKLIRT